jgi:hypothetical protein
MSTTGPEPTEEELRAAYEAELKKIRVEHVLLENVVTLINLGMRRTGLQAGTEDERDLGQVRLAIEAIRAVLPLIDAGAPPQAAQIRQALSQLQLAYVRVGGAPPAAGEAAAPGPGGPGTGAPGSVAPGARGPETAPAEPGQGAPEPADSAGGAPPPPPSEPPKPGEPGPAQRSGRLWVPGQ